jgi:mono/diheme cytochrome c family protein
MKLKIISGISIILFVLVVTCMFTSCQSDEEIEFKRYYSSGSLVYQTRCQNCHGAHGEGLLGLIPPLTDSGYLKTNKKNLACVVKYGLRGKITIKNRIFEEKMPPTRLSPIEIANVLTYITNSFGNKSGMITNQQIEKDLAGCR